MLREHAKRVGLMGAAVLALTTLTASEGTAQPATPSIALRSVTEHATAYRWEGDPGLYVGGAGVFVAATNGPFELDAIRTSKGVQVYPTVRSGGTVTRGAALRTPSPVSMTEGLPGFFTLTLRDGAGRRVASGASAFCPGGWYGQSRVDTSGPDRPTFPYYCGSDLTKATVWGIDRGWASPTGFFLNGAGVPDGDYRLTIAVADSYARQLAVPAAVASTQLTLTVYTDKSGGCTPEFPCGRSAGRSGRQAGPQRVLAAEQQGGTGTTAGTGLPNLAVLPAHNLYLEAGEDGRDYLSFGATMWNAGSGPLVVEGFRRGAAELMDAVQIVYRDGAPGLPTPIGTFEYDRRDGHYHWHFEDAGQYDLLDSAGQRVLLSGKQSFCLAPTDPIDLTATGADWQPDRAGLWSQCAGEESIWLREVMPAGWGDTYFQGVAGQNFDVTDLPNGTYRLRVMTNPLRRIQETTYDDNTALLTLTLAGTPGARTVSTP